jgi:hypothetical protein
MTAMEKHQLRVRGNSCIKTPLAEVHQNWHSSSSLLRGYQAHVSKHDELVVEGLLARVLRTDQR